MAHIGLKPLLVQEMSQLFGGKDGAVFATSATNGNGKLALTFLQKTRQEW